MRDWAASALIGIAVELGIAENLTHLELSTVQAMNLISDELFLPSFAGAFLFGLASGIAILRGARLPKWLGWVAIVIGVLALIPPNEHAGAVRTGDLDGDREHPAVPAHGTREERLTDAGGGHAVKRPGNLETLL